MLKKKSILYSISLMLFIDSIGGGLIFPILPELFLNNEFGLILDNTYLSREMLYSLSFALFPLACMFGLPILGAIADGYGKNKIILYGLGALTFNFLLSIISILIHDVWLFLLSRLLSGFLSGTYSVGAAIISDMSNTDEERISNFKLPTLASILGFILGPSLSLFVDKLTITNPLIAPFAIAFILGVINWVLLWNNFRGIDSQNNSASNLDHTTTNNNSDNSLLIKLKSIFNLLGYVFSNQYTIILAFSYLLLQFALGLYLQSLSLHLTLSYGYSPSMIARFFVVMALVMTMSMYLLQKLVTKYMNYKIQVEVGLITISLLLILEATLGISISNRLHIDYVYITWIVALILYLVIPFVTLGFTNLFANSVSKEEQGRVMGGSGQISSIAMFTSALIMGKVIMGYTVVLLISGISFILSYVILNNTPKKRGCFTKFMM